MQYLDSSILQWVNTTQSISENEIHTCRVSTMTVYELYIHVRFKF